MTKKLKRDQLPAAKAKNWRQNFEEEKDKTFNLKVPKIILQKATYQALAGENENRVRVYLGLEANKEDGKYVLCAFAVSAFLLGSGDVYADYETPVYKLDKKNIDFSNSTQAAIESIHLYRKWRSGELDAEDPGAAYRQYIYPNAYLLTKFELHELFVAQKKDEAVIDFGIEKTMSIMISGVSASTLTASTDEEQEDFDFAVPCPPFCDERSIYNS
ncbi:hypothetical protein [Maribellus sediminis]|uniref:hypothetical protein n=1 Tax=Maribellus sediminis TaxID=2696285 RepID=UPI0014317C00|nr:hypothetical protein [Maribellus sediminis]